MTEIYYVFILIRLVFGQSFHCNRIISVIRASGIALFIRFIFTKNYFTFNERINRKVFQIFQMIGFSHIELDNMSEGERTI